jgi:hypothetical protein
MEIERRAQELVDEWLRHYFSGQPFTTPGMADAEPGVNTLMLCELIYDQATPETVPTNLPLMHTIIVDKREGDPAPVGKNLAVVAGTWMWHTLVRVSPLVDAGERPSIPAATKPKIIAANQCRRLADQLQWLLRSPHAQDLAFKGMGNIRVISAPRLIQQGAWQMRQVIWSCDVSYHVALNDPS